MFRPKEPVVLYGTWINNVSMPKGPTLKEESC